MSREDELWAAIIEALKGDNVDIPTPVWRREEFSRPYLVRLRAWKT